MAIFPNAKGRGEETSLTAGEETEEDVNGTFSVFHIVIFTIMRSPTIWVQTILYKHIY
jgi:hypothetical protein